MEQLKKDLTAAAIQVGKELVKATGDLPTPPIYPPDGRNTGIGSDWDKANKMYTEAANHKSKLNQLFNTLLNAIQQVP